ncbi:hypothetical protein O988_05537 [Pseudogymnoascus sp. VKM F-3808]|nr:hypothetical protein O988_05537 [Pseudogymnoascus sp. VKM F-3808]
MHERRAQGDGRGVLDAQVEVGRVRKDAVARGGVGDGVADDLADFEVAGLLEEEHREDMRSVMRVWEVLGRGSLLVGAWWRGLVRGLAVSRVFRLEGSSSCGALSREPAL